MIEPLEQIEQKDTLNESEQLALNILVESILTNSKDFASQVPKDKIPLVLEQVNEKVKKQKEKYWPKPQSAKELTRNIKYFLENGFKKPAITDVKVLDIGAILEQRNLDKSNENLDIQTLTNQVLNKILEKFHILIRAGENTSVLTINKAIAEEKKLRKIDLQRLVIIGLETLPASSQAMLVELLVKHMAYKKTFSVTILHDQPITTYDQKSSLGLEPDGGYLDYAPAWPVKKEVAEK